MQSNSRKMLLVLKPALLARNLFDFKWPEKGDFSKKNSHIFWYLCQVEGHGGTLSKISLKFVQNVSLQIWKILCFLISTHSPLSHAIWILDTHPSIQTLAFLEHSGLWKSNAWKEFVAFLGIMFHFSSMLWIPDYTWIT